MTRALPAAVAASIAAIVGLAACGSDTGASGSAAPTSAPASAHSSRVACEGTCYPLPDILPAFCYVQQVRGLIRAGELPTSALPAWADRATRGGVPLIVDFRHADGEATTAKIDRLSPVLDGRGVEVDQKQITTCIGATSQRDVVRVEGGPYQPFTPSASASS